MSSVSSNPGRPAAARKTKGAGKAEAPAKGKTVTAEPAIAEKKPRSAAPRKRAGAVQSSADLEKRYRMIAEAAYYRAERRGFQGGSEADRADWLAAEQEIDALLAARH